MCHPPCNKLYNKEQVAAGYVSEESNSLIHVPRARAGMRELRIWVVDACCAAVYDDERGTR